MTSDPEEMNSGRFFEHINYETKNNSEESSDSLNDPETSSGKEKGEEIY